MRSAAREPLEPGRPTAAESAGGPGTVESSSSEGDMTWEDFLASTDDLGDAARAAALASASSLPVRRQLQAPPPPPAAPTQHGMVDSGAPHVSSGILPSGGGVGGRPRVPPPQQPPPLPPPAGLQDMPPQPSLAGARAKDNVASFGSGLTSWGTSKADEDSDDSSGRSGASAGGADGSGINQVRRRPIVPFLSVSFSAGEPRISHGPRQAQKAFPSLSHYANFGCSFDENGSAECVWRTKKTIPLQTSYAW